MNRDDVVLLTGYPSLLARAVCAELLASDPKARVVALVRAKFLGDARAAVLDDETDGSTVRLGDDPRPTTRLVVADRVVDQVGDQPLEQS